MKACETPLVFHYVKPSWSFRPSVLLFPQQQHNFIVYTHNPSLSSQSVRVCSGIKCMDPAVSWLSLSPCLPCVTLCVYVKGIRLSILVQGEGACKTRMLTSPSFLNLIPSDEKIDVQSNNNNNVSTMFSHFCTVPTSCVIIQTGTWCDWSNSTGLVSSVNNEFQRSVVLQSTY